MMARTRHPRKLHPMIVEDHAFSPRRVLMPATTNKIGNKTTASRRKKDTYSDDYFDDDTYNYTASKGSSSRSGNEQQRRQMQQQDDDVDIDDVEETERIMDMIHSVLPPDIEHTHYCVKQHLWYRVKPLHVNTNITTKAEETSPGSAQYLIEVGLAERSIQSVGDILYMSLYPKPGMTTTTSSHPLSNKKPQKSPWKLPDLTSHRDNIEPYKQIMITSNVPYKEGELFCTITWEGIEKEKGDEHDFVLVTGRNIWRCPIDGIVSLNGQYLHRNWAVDRPDTETPLLFIICSKEDYYRKLSQMYDGPLIVPDVENSTKEKKFKRSIDKSYNMNATNDGPLDQYYYPWVSPKDYDIYIEANGILQ
jgi:hypothetical protein